MKVDLRDQGTICFLASSIATSASVLTEAESLPAPLAELEPALAAIRVGRLSI